jgi:hypothetical protein
LLGLLFVSLTFHSITGSPNFSIRAVAIMSFS